MGACIEASKYIKNNLYRNDTAHVAFLAYRIMSDTDEI